MPKQSLVLNDFSGGINSVKDPRDLSDNELVELTTNFLLVIMLPFIPIFLRKGIEDTLNKGKKEK